MVMRKLFFRTTVNSGHRHNFTRGNEFTSKSSGHRHRVRGSVALRVKFGGHQHRILR